MLRNYFKQLYSDKYEVVYKYEHLIRPHEFEEMYEAVTQNKYPLFCRRKLFMTVISKGDEYGYFVDAIPVSYYKEARTNLPDFV